MRRNKKAGDKMKVIKCDICNKELRLLDGFRWFLGTKKNWFDGMPSCEADICDTCMNRIKEEVRHETKL